MASSSIPFHSFSVPSSPATTRKTNTSVPGGQPVTPQRLPPRQPQHRYSQSAYYRSPFTTSSESTASTLNTPETSMSMKKRHVDVHHSSISDISIDGKDKSLADLAQNWRARASQHGIKVSPSKAGNDSHYGDDEVSDKTSSDIGNDSSILLTDESLLPPAFMSYQRRSAHTRPRSLSHASLQENKGESAMSANCSLPLPASPVRPRRALVTRADNLLCTPPPNRALASQMKMKGSLTDPPQPRKRESLGNAIPSAGATRANATMNMLGDKSLDLFDINEHDLEYEGEHQPTDETFDESFSLDLQNHTANIFGYQQHQEPQFRSNPFADPFHIFDSNNGNNHVLSSIAESVEHHFHTLQHPVNLRYSPASNFFPPGEALFHQTAPPVFPEPSYAPIPQTLMPVPVHAPHMGGLPRPSFNPVYTPIPVAHHESLAPPKVELTEPPTDCSVCLASYPPSLAVLQPCRHPLCSGCLTSALNIVGEKDMECAVCKTAVADFKLVTIKKPAGKTSTAGEKHNAPSPLQDSPMIGVEPKELDGAFEFGFDDFASGIRASTPKMEQQVQGGRSVLEVSASSARSNKSTGKVILRIDNVPWDITPRQITNWLKQPVDRVHVLLDPKGKTLSHAYVEVRDGTVAGAILRGETAQPNAAGRRERGSVLGRGKRARGVTITRSSEAELMSNLFPSWRGRFEGSRPSLAGLEGDAIIRALEGGLLTDADLNSLRRLIQEPDSHFLKVPVLPFHSVLSILTRFPIDADSKVFWSTGMRDKLFDLVMIAIQSLIPRVDKTGRNEEYSVDLVLDLAKTAMSCPAFLPQQAHRVAQLLQSHSIPVPSLDQPSLVADSSTELSSQSEGGSFVSLLKTPENKPQMLRTAKEMENPFAPVPQFGGNKFAQNPPPMFAHGHPVQNGNGQERPAFADLAREFGVEAGLIQALAQRLASLH